MSMVERFFSVRFIRFLFVGVLNTLFGYMVYLLGLYIGLQAVVALAVATGVGAVFNYFTNARLVFRSHNGNKLIQFIGAYAIIYLVNALALQLLIINDVSPVVAQAILLPVMAIGAYTIFRLFVFKEPKEI